jgi:hypothetical protein
MDALVMVLAAAVFVAGLAVVACALLQEVSG